MKQPNKDLQSDNTDRPFLWIERIRSFGFAIHGIRKFLKSEHNAMVHLLATLLVFLAGLFFQVSILEWIALIVVMGMVWMAELLNTAIEKIVDQVAKERNDRWAFIKDVAAAAVLVAAMVAALTGMLIFVPKLVSLIAE
jgi:hypothetical protein